MCSFCKKPGFRGQNCFARNQSIGKLPFLAHKHAWCSLHRTNQHDNSAYIVQRRGSKDGTSRHHRFGQQNGQRNVDPTSATLLADAYSPAASSASSPANILYFFIAASSRSTFEYQFNYFFIASFMVFHVYYDCWRFIIASRRHRLLVHRNVVK